MLRIHFSLADLARLRLASQPDPLWELVLSMHVLHEPSESPWLGPWRQQMIRRLRAGGAFRQDMVLPLALNPHTGYFPDFLTPLESAEGFDAGLDAVLSTPKARLAMEVEQLAGRASRAAGLLDGIREGVPCELRRLESALRRYHELALAPIWGRIMISFGAERAERARVLADAGPEAMLASLQPMCRYRDGVLELPHFRTTRDVYLDGRGLVLIPSYFKQQHTLMALADSGLPQVLVCPLDNRIRIEAESRREPLVALLGRVRTEVLELASSPMSVSQIAGRLGITASAASKHLRVLSDAGLVIRRRDRNRVHHTLSTLGQSLLTGRLG
ncbi:transcriptional regulator [Rhizocola hellebori]|uniref:Transcriptional regulator n=1 Tax=Rhizocola hellebori TaxID=1392758 RepID=A0A8J3Q7X9_9ACTN|nr:ArsR family transcriptional regulator [Rhizocola hellebori]GIH05027.1 transcriptional regulator [Rhizocola hellebori]